MVKFKDFLDKAKEAAKKGLEIAKTQMMFERMLSDFDETVGTVVAEILQGHGYRGLRQAEQGDFYVVEMAVEDEGKVRHIIERDIMRRYSPKDREKITSIIPDRLRIQVRYTRKRQQASVLFSPAPSEDVHVTMTLYYFVERRGFLGVKRDERRVELGGFSFRSSDFIDYENKQVNKEKLREYLESKLRATGII